MGTPWIEVHQGLRDQVAWLATRLSGSTVAEPMRISSCSVGAMAYRKGLIPDPALLGKVDQ